MKRWEDRKRRNNIVFSSLHSKMGMSRSFVLLPETFLRLKEEISGWSNRSFESAFLRKCRTIHKNGVTAVAL